MGYQINVKIKKELPSEFKPTLTKVEVDKYKSILAMLTAKIKIEKLDAFSLLGIFNNIEFASRLYVNELVDNWKINLTDKIINNETWFSGWEISHKSDITIDDLKSDNIRHLTESLFQVLLGDNDEPTKYTNAFDIIIDYEFIVETDATKAFLKYCRTNPDFAELSDGIEYFYENENKD